MLEAEAKDLHLKDIEADSRALLEVENSVEASEVVKVLDLTIERIERNFLEEVATIKKIEESRDLTEAVVALEAAISPKEAVECMLAEAVIAEVALKVMKIEVVLEEVVLVPTPLRLLFKLLQEEEVNLPTTEETSFNDIRLKSERVCINQLL